MFLKIILMLLMVYLSLGIIFQLKNIYCFIKGNKNKIAFQIYEIFKSVPINNKKIVLINSHSYKITGNLKYIYEELEKNYIDYKVIVLTKKNLESIREVIKSYYHIATGKYVILNDYFTLFGNKKKRKGSKLIQVWHAAGAFKKFGKHSLQNVKAIENMQRSLKCHSQYDKVFVSSEKVRGIYADAFNLPLENVLPLGVPRTDFFYDEKEKNIVKKNLYLKYKQLEGKKVILYAPTYRDGEREKFDLKLDTKKITEELGKDYLIILKMHPYVKNSLFINSYEELNVLDLSNEDVNELMVISDCLITDYSSLCFEYSLLNKPMIFFAYDYESYGSELRGFYYDYEEFIPGPLVQTNDEIIELIKKNKFDFKKIKTFSETYFDHLDKNNSQRILETTVKATYET